MKVRIHYTLPDGFEDFLELEGTLEEIREQAAAEIKKRNATNPWSEQL